jgi:hypothetical protein
LGRRYSAGTLVVLVGVVLGFTGWGGLLVAVAATGIGLLPVLWGSRRMNCMGVLLLPDGGAVSYDVPISPMPEASCSRRPSVVQWRTKIGISSQED